MPGFPGSRKSGSGPAGAVPAQDQRAGSVGDVVASGRPGVRPGVGGHAIEAVDAIVDGSGALASGLRPAGPVPSRIRSRKMSAGVTYRRLPRRWREMALPRSAGRQHRGWGWPPGASGCRSSAGAGCGCRCGDSSNRLPRRWCGRWAAQLRLLGGCCCPLHRSGSARPDPVAPVCCRRGVRRPCRRRLPDEAHKELAGAASNYRAGRTSGASNGRSWSDVTCPRRLRSCRVVAGSTRVG
jgi:hypothetical protein